MDTNTNTKTTNTKTTNTKTTKPAAADNSGLFDLFASLKANISEKRPLTAAAVAVYGDEAKQTFKAWKAAAEAAQRTLYNVQTLKTSGTQAEQNEARNAAAESLAIALRFFAKNRKAFERRFPAANGAEVFAAAARDMLDYLTSGASRYATSERDGRGKEWTLTGASTFRKFLEDSVIDFMEQRVFYTLEQLDAFKEAKSAERKRRKAEADAKKEARAREIAAAMGLDYDDEAQQKLAWEYLKAENAVKRMEEANDEAAAIKAAAKVTAKTRKLADDLAAAEAKTEEQPAA